MPTDPSQLEEPMYRILRAQQANLARIETDLVMPGTTGTGGEIKLWGPAPNLIRLYDTPMRMIEDRVLENWERLITLSPVTDDEDGRILGRNDRKINYQIHFAVRLTPSEQDIDRDQMVTGVMRADDPLALKAHRLIYDFHHVFATNQNLALTDVDECHLVDSAGYTMSWVTDFEYPVAVFVANVVSQVSAW